MLTAMAHILPSLIKPPFAEPPFRLSRLEEFSTLFDDLSAAPVFRPRFRMTEKGGWV